MSASPVTWGSALRSRLAPSLAVALACFAGLGLYDGALGTAWPSIRRSLALPIGDLGLVQLAATAGFLCSSAISGRVSARIGRARGLAAAGGLTACALAAYAAAPDVVVLLLAAAVIGVAAGHLEPGLQAHLAVTAGPRSMNLLHACYGIGATIGPLLITGLLVLGWSWRFAYVVILGVELGVALAVLRRRADFDATTPARPPRETARVKRRRPVEIAGQPMAPPGTGAAAAPLPRAGTAAAPLPRAGVAMALLLFFLYCGVEMGTGQWAFTFFTAARHLSPGLAGLLVAGYWASLTLVRLVTAAIGGRISSGLLLALSAGGAVAGEGLMLWEPATAVGAAGFLIIGASLAPAFPLMMSRTAAWAGNARVSSVIGWQSAAASIGVAVPSALAGLLIDDFGLGALMPYLCALSVSFLLLQLAALRTLGQRA
jgi:fucose permease